MLDVVRDAFDSIAEEKTKRIGLVLTYTPSPTKCKYTYLDRYGHSKFGIVQTVSEGPSGMTSKLFYRSQASHGLVETILETARDFRPISHELYVSKQNTRGPIIRPWLYGNWWLLNNVPGGPHQLIGFGVRVGCGPRIEDAIGNTSQISFYRGSGVRIFTDPCVANSPVFLMPRLTVRIVTPLWRMIPGRKIEFNSESDSTFEKILSWLRDCDEQHQCVSDQPFMPTRVLDLRSGGKVKLLETHGMKGRYSALSHCWGKSPTVTTTSASFRSHQEGISLSALPKTFQDACAISLVLGIQYLWIDSLCIIQGDSADWEREASRMGDVYSNAYLTIAASTSVDTNSGCFTSRKISHYIPPDCKSTGLNEVRRSNLKVQVRSECSELSDLYMSKEWMPTSFKENPRLYQIGSFGSWIDPVEKELLNQRGWTLQERYLSPRVIHYAADQVYFQCKATTVAEDGSRFEDRHSIRDILGGEHLGGIKTSFRQKRSLIKGESPVDLDSPFEHRRLRGWNSLVETYSRRKLTFDSDKLPAMSGLANMISQKTYDQYLAGVWRNHIFEDLLWRVYPHEEVMRHLAYEESLADISYGKKLSEISFPLTYRAPSWSWASVDGSVKFEKVLGHCIKAQLLDACVLPLGNDPFGRVKSGWLKIRVLITIPPKSCLNVSLTLKFSS